MLEPSPTLPLADPADTADHPPSDDLWWQESSLFIWSDPRSGMAGEYRFGLHHNRGVANLYTWTSAGGEIVDKRVEHDLPRLHGLNLPLPIDRGPRPGAARWRWHW